MCPGRQGSGAAPGASAVLGLALWPLRMSPQSPVIAETVLIFFVANP